MTDPTQHPHHPRRRFLLDKARSGNGLGYTDIPELAMRDEPEALDQDDWERHVDREAKQKRAAQRAGHERVVRLLSQEERLAKAMAEAKAKRRDVSREVLVLRRMQERRKVDQIERRLQSIERIAYLGRAA